MKFRPVCVQVVPTVGRVVQLEDVTLVSFAYPHRPCNFSSGGSARNFTCKQQRNPPPAVQVERHIHSLNS